MNHSQLAALLSKKNITLALLVGLLVSSAAFAVIGLVTPRHKAQMDFLIVQNAPTSDFYALFKSSEFLSELFADAVHTEQFINLVVATKTGKLITLPQDPRKRIEEWKKLVHVSNRYKLGRLDVTVTHDDRQMVDATAIAIGDVLIQQNATFRGGSADGVDVRLLTGPIFQKNPSLRDVIFAMIFSFIAGVAATFAIVYVRFTLHSARVATTLHPQSKRAVSFDDANVQENAHEAWDASFAEIAEKLNNLQQK